MTDDSIEALLALARRAAAAGAQVLAGRDPEKFTASVKSGETDLVTEIDLAAERAVRQTIQQERPHDWITGEELAPSVNEPASGYRWSVDPLDGTMNFVRNIAYYGTSVAVIGPDGEWLAGVVAAPALGRTYYAAKGGGAWLEQREADGVLRARRLNGPRERRTGRLLATALTYEAEIQARLIAQLEVRMRDFGDFRRLGSAALELCAVAEGGVDAYLEYGLYEHDFAAGALIAEEAGAWVRRPQLSPAVNGLPPRSEALSHWTAAAVPELVASFVPAETDG